MPAYSLGCLRCLIIPQNSGLEGFSTPSTGGLLAASIAYEHRLMPQQARHLRTSILLLHVLLLWPLPVLLIFHILKSYYF